MQNCRPCVDPEMRNALAIERNTAAITALTTSFRDILSKFEIINHDVEDLKKRLKEIIIEKIDEIFNEKIEKERSERIAADNELHEICNNIDDSKASKVDLEEEKVNRSDADLLLHSKIKEVEETATRLVNREAGVRESADKALDERIVALEGGMGPIEDRIAAERKARQEGDADLERKISTEAKARSDGDAELSVRIEAAFGRMDEIQADVNLREKKEVVSELAGRVSDNATQISSLTTMVDSISSNITSLGEKISANETRIETLGERVKAAEETVSGFEDSIHALQDSIVETNAKTKEMIEKVEVREHGHYTALSTRISELEKLLREIVVR